MTSVVDGEVLLLEEGRPVGLELPAILGGIRQHSTGWRRQLHALGSVTVFDGACVCCG